jgi:predicted nucleic acid-binding protein
VIDNTVLTNFCLVDRLGILHALFGKVYVTHEVREEVLCGLDEGYRFMSRAEAEIGIGAGSWLELVGFDTSAEEQSFREFTEGLGFGEASCLALARHRGWMVLTDDKSARQRLRREKLPFTGTVGILRLAVERELLSAEEGNDLLHQMTVAGYHSPYHDLRDIDERLSGVTLLATDTG